MSKINMDVNVHNSCKSLTHISRFFFYLSDFLFIQFERFFLQLFFSNLAENSTKLSTFYFKDVTNTVLLLYSTNWEKDRCGLLESSQN